MTDQYTKQLENVIKQMLKPLKGIPFGIVISSLYDKEVLGFDKNNQDDINLLDFLISAADFCGNLLNQEGIYSKRVNEVGNKIEPYIIKSLNQFGLKASKPHNSGDKIISSGYPDIYFIDKANRHNYLECKTYNHDSLNSSLRSFYLSPSATPKIIYDARHFALSFEVVEIQRGTNQNLYKFASWKLMSLEKLLVNVKYEFNCDNISLYDKSLVLAEKKLNI